MQMTFAPVLAAPEKARGERKALCAPILADFDAWMTADHGKLADGAPNKKGDQLRAQSCCASAPIS